MVVGALNGFPIGAISEAYRVVAAATPVVTPFNSTRLRAWLDSSDSLLTDGDGRVYRWNDKWAVGSAATQVDPTRRPRVNVGPGTSLQCLFFNNGENTYLDASYLAPMIGTGRSPWAISFVWNVGRQDVNQFPVAFFNPSTGEGIYTGFIGISAYGERSDGPSNDAVASEKHGGPFVYTLGYDGFMLYLRVNGFTYSTAASTRNVSALIAWIGGDPRSGGDRFVFANFMELVVYDAWDAAVIASFESYAQSKWAANFP